MGERVKVPVTESGDPECQDSCGGRREQTPRFLQVVLCPTYLLENSHAPPHTKQTNGKALAAGHRKEDRLDTRVTGVLW